MIYFRVLVNTPTCLEFSTSAKKNTETFTNRVKKTRYTLTHDNIIHEHLYRDGLYLNTVAFSILTENGVSYIRRNRLQIETQNQKKNTEDNSSENTGESRDDIVDGFKTLRLKHPQNPLMTQININSIRNKFETLVSLVTSEIDILMISETKIDESFPLSHFMIDGFSMPFRRDRNAHGGGICLFQK